MKLINRYNEAILQHDIKYLDMYRVLWPDGTLSDMVNKTRANDAIRVFSDKQTKTKATMPSQGPTEPAGEFK